MQDVADLRQPPAPRLANDAAPELDHEVVAQGAGRIDHRLDEAAGLLDVGVWRRGPVPHGPGVTEHLEQRFGVFQAGAPQPQPRRQDLGHGRPMEPRARPSGPVR